MAVRLLQILSVTFLLLSTLFYPATAKDNYSSSSVLSSGQWIRIAVVQDGIYRIDYAKLKQLGLLNASNPRIYANNFGQLSYYNDPPKPDDLKEVAILTLTGTDGIFNEGDYLLFFGQGTGRWKYSSTSGDYDFIRHNYSDTAFYFLTSGTSPGKKISDRNEPAGASNYFSSESDALFIHEQESENLFKSGREWYQPFPLLGGIKVNPGFTDLLTDELIKFRIRVLARAPVPTQFRLYEGTTVHKSIQVEGVNMFNYTGTYAQITDSSGSAMPLSASPSFEIKFFNNGESGAKGWLDFVTFHGRKRNSYSGNISFLTDSRSAGSGRITEFSVKSPDEDPYIWDISEPSNPKNIRYVRTGETIKFKTMTDSLRSFVVFSETNTLQPVIKPGTVVNQNLHGSEPADMIIVTHPLFRQYAEKLAGIHLANSGLISQIVIPEQIYNEFSGGIPDIAAIRNFIRMKYMKQSGTKNPLKYLLLFGDGSFENKTMPPGNPNFIPTYQSQNSNVVVSSFTSDDFYGLLDDGEGEADGTEDIGIGRLPVSDTAQAGIVINKIVRYLDPANNGDWKNIVCISADDEDGNTHMSDAEGLALFLKDSVPACNIDKIYLDAFRQVTSVNGQSYPDVTKAINNRINSGCLVFNYVGHGNENGLAHESVVRTEDINSWKNGLKLPLFITATCEFSRFDDVEMNIISRIMTGRTSAGEMVLFNDDGGAIALMSTTRVVYSAPNYFLNRNIYDFAFDSDESGNPLRLGDIIRLAKNNSGNGPNKRNFSLLGDPAVRLAYPLHGTVVTDSINHESVFSNPDSLKALARVTVSGHIENNRGLTLRDFNGIVSPIVYDKALSIKTLANDGGQSMNFELRNNVLFSGKTKASDGKFSFEFIVPRDINYSYGPGKISYYANDNEQDMNGFFSEIIVGGFANESLSDTEGPVINLYMNDTLFRNGGLTDKNPRLLAIIEDKGGINTTGAGIGHDLIAYLDNDPKTSFILNNFFENDFDSFMKGKVSYDLSGLTEGSHSLTIKAWDNYNNSSQESLLFVVEKDGRFILRNLMNYPNPILYGTKISAEHNRPDGRLEITVTIFDMSGRIIRIIKEDTYSDGFQLSPVTWDGNSEEGRRVGKGIYPYRVSVTSENGETAVGSGRMIIL